MMKARSSRVMGEQVAASSRIKAEVLAANGAANQQAAAAAAQARKRRSSINVYDQPSSLNSRLRQLETDMLRLDEDRTKLFDDTHSALAQYELKLGEIHAILKSRQDNVEKYVEDMKLLLQAKEDFEKQTKLLNDRHDRIHEKFMHRETIISREIKLLKNKFEILEKNRQFRSMLQKSNQMTSGDNTNDDLISGLEGSSELSSRNRSETTTLQTGEPDLYGAGIKTGLPSAGLASDRSSAAKSVRIKMSKLGNLSKFLAPIFGSDKRGKIGRRKSNKISSAVNAQAPEATGIVTTIVGLADGDETNANNPSQGADSSFHIDSQESAVVKASITQADGVSTLADEKMAQQQLKKRPTGFLGRLFGG